MPVMKANLPYYPDFMVNIAKDSLTNRWEITANLHDTEQVFTKFTKNTQRYC